MKAQLEASSKPHDPNPQTGASHLTERLAADSPGRWARIAGSLYLINIIGGFFAIGYVPAAIVVSGDAIATAQHILAHELLYRLGIVIHILVLLTNLPLTVIFYDLFKVVNRRLSLLVACFLLVGTAIEGAYLLNQFAPLILLDGGRSVSGLTATQLQAQVSTPLELLAIGYSLAQVFYIGYLLLTAYLIVRSTFLPRAVGVLLAIGGLCYLVYSFADFLAPTFAAHLVPSIQVPSGIGELSLCLWLLVRGVNAVCWKEQAGAAGGSNRS
ncbi:MAG TPA: DUF4386 domain-containing protein [Ktedonobacterales bacterium]|jgi:hypothetical protein